MIYVPLSGAAELKSAKVLLLGNNVERNLQNGGWESDEEYETAYFSGLAEFGLTSTTE